MHKRQLQKDSVTSVTSHCKVNGDANKTTERSEVAAVYSKVGYASDDD